VRDRSARFNYKLRSRITNGGPSSHLSSGDHNAQDNSAPPKGNRYRRVAGQRPEQHFCSKKRWWLIDA
jgi:hypothetical protein